MPGLRSRVLREDALSPLDLAAARAAHDVAPLAGRTWSVLPAAPATVYANAPTPVMSRPTMSVCMVSVPS